MTHFDWQWNDGLRWDYYGGRFLVSNTLLHESTALNPDCAWLRRLVPTR